MRKLKPQKVDTMLMRCGTVTLYLDRDKLDFFATLGLEEVRDPTVAGLRKLVATKLEDWKPEAWEGFIAVSCSDPDDDFRSIVNGFETRKTYMEFEFFRGERAAKLDGSIMEREHRLDREERLKLSGYKDTQREELRASLEKETRSHWVDDSYVVLPYSDEAWAKLCEAELALREIRKRIHKTVHSKQFLKTLSGASFKLLPPKGSR